MKLEQQVTSRELSQKLKELGVKQESLFYWHFTEYEDAVVLLGSEHLSIVDEEGMKRHFVGYFSTFTVAELGELLPGNDGEAYFETQKGLMGRIWYCTRVNLVSNDAMYKTEADTEAEARGLMLVYLLENKLITL